jgi:hypothetical protein
MTRRGSPVRRGSVAVLFVAACIGISAPAATASSGGTPHRPTLLWKSFPLAQPSGANRSGATPALAHGNARDPLIVGVLLAAIVGSGVVMLAGVPTTNRLAAARRRFRRALPRR